LALFSNQPWWRQKIRPGDLLVYRTRKHVTETWGLPLAGRVEYVGYRCAKVVGEERGDETWLALEDIDILDVFHPIEEKVA